MNIFDEEVVKIVFLFNSGEKIECHCRQDEWMLFKTGKKDWVTDIFGCEVQIIRSKLEAFMSSPSDELVKSK